MGGGASVPENSLKKNGDDCFRIGQFSESIYWYTRALLEEPTSDLKVQAALYSNRSAAYDASGQFETSLADALHVIHLRPDWPKGYYRAAKACEKLNRNAEGIYHLSTALLLEPGDETLLELEKRLMDRGAGAENVNRSPFKGVSLAYSWGNGQSGQLGLGAPLGDKVSPSTIEGFCGKCMLAVSCGAMHSVAISTLGEAYAWGNNSHRQLGIRQLPGFVAPDGVYATPVLIPKLIGTKVVAVSSGAGHNAVITNQGDVYTWGVGKQGQLGLGVLENVAEPQLVTAMQEKKVVAVSCGIAHTVFLLEDGRVECCGLNQYGQLGIDSMDEQVHTPVPAKFPLEDDLHVSHIACGGGHTLAVDSNGSLYSTGSNSCGQLGLGDNRLDDRRAFTRVAFFDGPVGRLQCAFVACGEEFSAVITRERSVYTWGLGIVGQLGNGSVVNSSVPVHVRDMDGKGVDQLCCSQGQVLAVTSSGEVWTWGLPGDQAHMAELDPSVIIKSPQRVAAFSRRKKIQQLVCGRKHYVLLTVGAYGPFCVVTKGLNSDGEATDARAGECIRFIIQARDFHDEPCDTGGSVFTGRIDHEAIDYELKFRLQVLGQSRADQLAAGTTSAGTSSDVSSSNAGTGSNLVNGPTSLPMIEFDDNMDGTYGGQTRLYLAGEYRLGIFLGGEHIMGSPFHVTVAADKPFGPKCSIWWGKYAIVATTATATAEAKQQENVSFCEAAAARESCSVECTQGEKVVFTVSCRDKYGNNCASLLKSYLDEYFIGAAQKPLELFPGTTTTTAAECSGSESKAETTSGTIPKYDSSLEKKIAWKDSHNGVFPCVFEAPAAPGIYELRIGVNGKFDADSAIGASPFRVLVKQRVEISSAKAEAPIENSAAPTTETVLTAAAAEVAIESDEKDGATAATEELLQELSGREMTAKRAQDALRREQARLQKEREERRRKTAAKRTGGGFIIQYSKDI